MKKRIDFVINKSRLIDNHAAEANYQIPTNN